MQNKMERGGACINVNTNILIVLSFHEQNIGWESKKCCMFMLTVCNKELVLLLNQVIVKLITWMSTIFFYSSEGKIAGQ